LYCILQDSQRFDDLLSTRFEFLPLSDLILSKAPACRNFWKAHYPAEFLLGKGRVTLKSTMLSRVPWETEERRKVSHCFMSSNGLKLGCSWYKHPLKQGVPIKTPHYKGHLFWGQNTALLQGPLISRMPHSEGDTLLFLEFFLREGVPALSSLNQTMSFSPNSDHSVAHHNRIIVCRTHNFVCLPGCQPYHRIFGNLHMRTNSWVMTLGYLAVCPSVHVHLALSGALSGPDNAGLWRTVWFCCRVWLFDCGSYLNRKEFIIVSTLECMPMDITIVYSLEGSDFEFPGPHKKWYYLFS
jgi:hypothetical protein